MAGKQMAIIFFSTAIKLQLRRIANTQKRKPKATLEGATACYVLRVERRKKATAKGSELHFVKHSG